MKRHRSKNPTGLQTARISASRLNARSASGDLHPISASQGPNTTVKTFVEEKFIPGLVELKSEAGRRHYHSILKYILSPKSVQQMLSAHQGQRKGRLTSTTNWPYLDNVRLCDLTAERVRQLVSYASDEGYSPQTLKHIRNVIGAIIKHAKRERVFDGENPICDVQLPTMIRRNCHCLSLDQAKAILKVMKYPEREVALLTICTGLGVPEICALRWKHVNLSHVAIHQNGGQIPPRSIMVEKLSLQDAFRPVQPKAERFVAISETLAAALTDLRQRHGSDDPNNFLLSAPGAYPQSSLSARWLKLKPVSRELQMPWLSWQVLRRAHHAFLEELMITLTDELVSSAFCKLSVMSCP